ncbi:actin-like ATPase domain-containing protein [Wilcoxina mikolae CBS 423.85]|nr:actin-like ATPase domain-containing protein [Wilcoxina mikolae CBS 423.85]
MPPPSIPSLLSALCPPETSQLHIISSTLVSCIKLHLLDPVGATMLPSYTHTLPRGTETGAALAVDLGGSTLRVAVVRFSAEGKEVVRRKQWGVDEDVKILQGGEFFDWVAERVAEVVGEKEEEEVMGYGLTWSFPIVQTSEGSGEIQKMGKGFRIHEGILGEDLRTHFEAAFKRRNLNNLRLTYLLNDTAAALLSHAYDNPKTCISLICGTGVNAALLLPVHALHPQKFGVRPREWFEAAEKVLVNTECSMLGGEVMFPLTDADRLLDEMAELPGFQPFEQLTGGRYLGEVARLTLVDAGILEIAGGGGRWSLSSEVLAAFEELFTHPQPPPLPWAKELYLGTRHWTRQCVRLRERMALPLPPPISQA